MSSDEEEGGGRGGRMAFTDQNDYEGGKWVGGEYYFKNQRGGVTQTKDEQLYGVFAEGSSDEEERAGTKRKKGSRDVGDTKPDLSKPMNFVGGRGRTGSAPRLGADDETDEGSDLDDSHPATVSDDDGDDNDDDRESDARFPGPGGEPSPPIPPRSLQNQQHFRELLNAAAADSSRSHPSAEGRTSSPSGVRNNADFRAMLSGSSGSQRNGGTGDVNALRGSTPSQAESAGVGSRAGLGTGRSTSTTGTTSEPATAGKSDPEPVKVRKPAKLDANFGSWEKNTKGIGSKLMKKMGFTGRLGKEETGVTRQLEVKVRPGLSGLGYGNFKEATTLKVNREIEADRQGKTLEQLEAEMGVAAAGGGRGRGPKSKGERIADKGLWRKGAPGKKRKRFVTPEEFLQKQEEEAGKSEEQPAPKQIIVDMRGPQTKLVSTMEDLAPLATGLDEGEEPKLGQELLHNVGLMVGLAETEMQTLHHRIRGEQDTATALEKDISDLTKRVDSSDERLARLDQVEVIINRVHEKVTSDPDSVTADNILKAFRTLRDRYPEEYAVFGLAQLVPAMAAPVIKRALAGWNPLKSVAEPAKLLSSWRDVLTDTSQVHQGEGQAMRWEGQAAFEALAHDLVLPSIRSSLVNHWHVKDAAPALAVVEALVLAGVGDGIVQALIDQAVLPKLTRGVSEWNPRTDRVAIHSWIHPWLPLLGKRLAGLFPEIRRKLSKVLADWQASDPSAYHVLSPWKQVFDARSMEALLKTSIVPKLVGALRSSLVINPANQDMAAFNMLMLWSDLIPSMYFTSILDGEFFPQWLTVLHQWLSNTADYAEVARWYQGWKDSFPEHVRSDPRVMAQFNSALTLMEQVMQDHQHQGVPLPPGASEQLSYDLVVERRAMEAAAMRQQQQAMRQQQQQMQVNAAASAIGRGAASFREVVEAFAESNGIMFLPKTGRQFEGKQIYSFGGVSVYLDQSVAFTEIPRGSRQWSPIGLEDLLNLTGHGKDSAKPGEPNMRGQPRAGVGSHPFGGID